MTIRQKLKNIVYQVAHPMMCVYWYIFRPKTSGAKCLIEYNGKFLLVRLNYAHRRWTVPGGGVHRRESFVNAATREAKEETGIDIFNPILIGRYESIIEYKKDTVEVYYGIADNSAYVIDPVEIKEAAWFSKDSLPEDRMPRVDFVFKLYNEHKLRKN